MKKTIIFAAAFVFSFFFFNSALANDARVFLYDSTYVIVSGDSTLWKYGVKYYGSGYESKTILKLNPSLKKAEDLKNGMVILVKVTPRADTHEVHEEESDPTLEAISITTLPTNPITLNEKTDTTGTTEEFVPYDDEEFLGDDSEKVVDTISFTSRDTADILAVNIFTHNKGVKITYRNDTFTSEDVLDSLIIDLGGVYPKDDLTFSSLSDAEMQRYKIKNTQRYQRLWDEAVEIIQKEVNENRFSTCVVTGKSKRQEVLEMVQILNSEPPFRSTSQKIEPEPKIQKSISQKGIKRWEDKKSDSYEMDRGIANVAKNNVITNDTTSALEVIQSLINYGAIKICSLPNGDYTPGGRAAFYDFVALYEEAYSYHLEEFKNLTKKPSSQAVVQQFTLQQIDGKLDFSDISSRAGVVNKLLQGDIHLATLASFIGGSIDDYLKTIHWENFGTRGVVVIISVLLGITSIVIFFKRFKLFPIGVHGSDQGNSNPTFVIECQDPGARRQIQEALSKLGLEFQIYEIAS